MADFTRLPLRLLVTTLVCGFALELGQTNADVTHCRYCLPTLDDPLKCQNLETSSYAASCTGGDICATILFPAKDTASVSMRGCAKLVDHISVDKSKECVKLPHAPNFYFTKVVIPESTPVIGRNKYIFPGTDEERRAGSALLTHLFPKSDSSRVLRDETPIKSMLTFHSYPETTVCVCQDDNCNGHLSSGNRNVIWTTVFLFFALCRLFS